MLYLGQGAAGAGSAVDIFNATNGAWSTAALSVAREDLVATSLPNYGIALFAGGGGCGVYYVLMSVIARGGV